MARDHFEEAEDKTEDKTQEQKDIEEAIIQNKRNYIACFQNHPGKGVLKDLKNYCRLEESTYNLDPIKMAYLNGVRDAGLYIVNMAKLENTPKPIDKEEEHG